MLYKISLYRVFISFTDENDFDFDFKITISTNFDFKITKM